MQDEIRQRVAAAALARAKRAEEEQAWPDAVIAYETAAAVEPGSSRRWLDLARCRFRAGEVDRAWEACLVAADLGRAQADPTVVAEAATIVVGPTAAALRRQVHELCREADAALGEDHPQWRARVREVIAAT